MDAFPSSDEASLRYGTLEHLAGLKLYCFGRRDGHFLLGAGIAADAGGTLPHFKGTKAHQLNLFPLC